VGAVIATFERVGSLIRLSPRVEGEAKVVSALSARLRASDVAVHERALRELLPEVRRWVGALVRGADGEDVSQEALTAVAAALHRYEGRSSLRSLARTITVRTAMKALKRRRRHPRGETDVELESPGADPERLAMQRDTVDRVRGHMQRLTPQRRVALLLCVVEGLSPTEAAREVGCSALAMRGRLHQARAQLRVWLEEDEALRARLEGGA